MKKSITLVSLTLSLLIINCNSYAQEQDDVTVFRLKDVIKLAQEQSPSAMVAKLSYMSQYWGFKSYKAEYLPDVYFSGTLPSISKGVRKVETVEGDQYVNNSTESFNGTLSIRQKVGWTGGTFSISTSLNRSDNTYNDIKTRTYSGSPININYEQKLFGFNNFKWDKKIEPKKFEKAKKKYIETLEDISIQATNTFFNLLNADLQLTIAKKNHADYDTLYNVSKGRFQLGKISEADLLKIEIQKLQSENSLSDAKISYDDALFKFKSFLRISNVGNIHLVPPKEVFKLNVNIQKAVDLAKRNTSKALDLELNELNTEKALEQAKRERNPGVQLRASYGLSNSADILGDVYKDPIKSQGLSLGISVPLLDWGRKKGRYKIAEYIYQMDKTNQEQERIDFEQDVRLKVIKFSKLNDRLMIASKKNIIAEKSFELTQKRYMIGKIQDIRKLTEAQQEYDRAQNEYYNEIKNFWVQYFSLRKLTLYDFKKNKMIDVNFDKLQ